MKNTVSCSLAAIILVAGVATFGPAAFASHGVDQIQQPVQTNHTLPDGTIVVRFDLPEPEPVPVTSIVLDAVSYDATANRLVLDFTGKVNWFMVDVDQISVRDGTCMAALEREEFVGLTRDWKSAVFNLTDANRQALTEMAAPTVHLGLGGFVGLDDSLDVRGALMPVDVVGGSQNATSDCPITYRFSEQKLNATTPYYAEISQAIHDGFAVWSELNPELVFEWTNSTDPLIEIDVGTVRAGSETLGYACTDCLTYDAEMWIGVAKETCQEETMYFDAAEVRHTVAHEIGHVLGLLHHEDEDHLMYGHGDENTEDHFDALGFDVPNLSAGHVIGEAEMEERLAELDMQIDEYAARHVVDVDPDGTLVFSSYGTMTTYNDMVEEYNDTVEALNCIWEPKPGPAPITPDWSLSGFDGLPDFSLPEWDPPVTTPPPDLNP